MFIDLLTSSTPLTGDRTCNLLVYWMTLQPTKTPSQGKESVSRCLSLLPKPPSISVIHYTEFKKLLYLWWLLIIKDKTQKQPNNEIHRAGLERVWNTKPCALQEASKHVTLPAHGCVHQWMNVNSSWMWSFLASLSFGVQSLMRFCHIDAIDQIIGTRLNSISRHLPFSRGQTAENPNPVLSLSGDQLPSHWSGGQRWVTSLA